MPTTDVGFFLICWEQDGAMVTFLGVAAAHKYRSRERHNGHHMVATAVTNSQKLAEVAAATVDGPARLGGSPRDHLMHAGIVEQLPQLGSLRSKTG